ncbi:MAG: hypothetical protein KME45_01245 [Stenomitos rutilans HA7619-LM2]|nr:hypothetical protein [Stenomitos rutilans HA7619-LM2]
MTATDQSVGRGKAMPCPYRMCRIFNSNWYHIEPTAPMQPTVSAIDCSALRHQDEAFCPPQGVGQPRSPNGKYPSPTLRRLHRKAIINPDANQARQALAFLVQPLQ